MEKFIRFDNIPLDWPDVEIHSLEVFDARGRKIASEAGSLRGLRQFDLKVSDWSDGLYTISLKHSAGLLSQRFLKH